MPVLSLRSSAWYGDHQVQLTLPDEWEVARYGPNLPGRCRDDALDAALDHPSGQPPLATAARGCRRPVIVVDDLSRPTPVARVLPLLLDRFEAAGIPADAVTVIVGSGTHGAGAAQRLTRKVGVEVAGRARIIGHDDRRSLVTVGRTSFGTPVRVNRVVATADYVVGVGGVYPQHSTGFGGGSKAMLGVLGRGTIMRLHYGHRSVDGTYTVANDFRRDLDEIADLVGLRTSVSIHVDADREITRMVAGDHRVYYPSAVEFSLRAYAAPRPVGADLVIANAYPMDLSLSFLRSKAMAPLRAAAPSAVRVLVAGVPEGVGVHGLFPFFDRHPAVRLRSVGRRLVVHPGRAPSAALARARRIHRSPAAGPDRLPVILYTPRPVALPAELPGMRRCTTWTEVLDLADRWLGEGRAGTVRAAVYACAPLQVLLPAGAAAAGAVGEAA